MYIHTWVDEVFSIAIIMDPAIMDPHESIERALKKLHHLLISA